MAIIQGNAKQGSTRGFYPKVINGSLRFNDNDSAYLEWIPTSTGDRKNWTLSMWFKRCTFGVNHKLFDAFVDDTNRTFIQFHTDDKLTFFSRESGTNNLSLQTAQVFRDPSAWYHLVAVADFDNATQTERGKIYINGQQVTSFSSTTYPASTSINTMASYASAQHKLAANDDSVGVEGYFDGYLANVHFVDGQALTADDFGETKNGVWVAKDYAGTFGTNGFYLTFEDDTEVEAFNTVLWRGDGSSSRSITGTGFTPDLVWIKNRTSGSYNHHLVDAVRGVSLRLVPNGTQNEGASFVTSFDSDGFTVNDNTTVNGSSNDYVAWCWKAGDSNVSNTDGTITSTVRANPTYGFSIVSWTGNGSTNQSVGHGLSTAPSLIISKKRDASGSWYVTGSLLGTDGYMFLDTTEAQLSASGYFPAPDSDVFYVSGTNSGSLNNSNNYISYCWSETTGYSKFGSYDGDGTNNGSNEITLGFKPSLVIIKPTTTANNWVLFDNTRSAGLDQTTDTRQLRANTSDSESYIGYTNNEVELTDNSFKLWDGLNQINGSGQTYIYAAFADTREAAFWLDQSGNDNDWQPVNLDHNDTVADSPTNNYCTLNPLFSRGEGTNGNSTLSDGNLKSVWSGSSITGTRLGTMGVSSGKWYFEADWTDNSASTAGFGFVAEDGTIDDGRLLISASGLYMCAVDMDNLLIWFGVDGVWTGDPEAGTGGTSIPDVGTRCPFVRDNSGTTGNDWTVVCNFGQQPWAYTPPTDFNALSTANLPDPVIDPAQGASPEDYFNTVLYDGSASAQSITGVGFQPDFVWIKKRSGANSHNLVDVVRGADKRLFSNTTNSEFDNTGFSFDSDGFTVTTSGSQNESGFTFVGWNWKANGSGVTNTDGSITSTVSANTTSGFSIVQFTGQSTAGTVGHGLDQTPEFIVVKSQNSVSNWTTFHTPLGSNSFLKLNTTDATGTVSGYWGTPNSTTFGVVGGGYSNNISGDSHIAYVFHSVEGFSKFGSYVGNGSADGPFVYTGFRPAFLIYKGSSFSGDGWSIWDSKRDTINGMDRELLAQSSSAEGTATDYIDFVSNGFKIRTSGGSVNASGQTYIYMAFAEDGGPFKYSLAR